MSPLISLIILFVLGGIIYLVWNARFGQEIVAARQKKQRPSIQKVIESVGGEIISVSRDTESDVNAYTVVYTDKLGRRLERHAIEHRNYRPNVPNGGYYWDKPIASSIIKEAKSKEQIISEMAAEIEALKKELDSAENHPTN